MGAFKVAAATYASVTIAMSAIAQAPASDQASKTPTGATFTIPAGWTGHETGPVLVLDAPETDTHVAIVPISHAHDAKSAAAFLHGAVRPHRGITTMARHHSLSSSQGSSIRIR